MVLQKLMYSDIRELTQNALKIYELPKTNIPMTKGTFAELLRPITGKLKAHRLNQAFDSNRPILITSNKSTFLKKLNFDNLILPNLRADEDNLVTGTKYSLRLLNSFDLELTALGHFNSSLKKEYICFQNKESFILWPVIFGVLQNIKIQINSN